MHSRVLARMPWASLVSAPRRALHPHLLSPCPRARPSAAPPAAPPAPAGTLTLAPPCLPLSPSPLPYTPPPVPAPHLLCAPHPSLLSSSPLGEAGDHRTRYWVASAEGCQVRRTVLGVTEARVSAWGGGRSAGGDRGRKFKKMWQQAKSDLSTSGSRGRTEPVNPW